MEEFLSLSVKPYHSHSRKTVTVATSACHHLNTFWCLQLLVTIAELWHMSMHQLTELQLCRSSLQLNFDHPDSRRHLEKVQDPVVQSRVKLSQD